MSESNTLYVLFFLFSGTKIVIFFENSNFLGYKKCLSTYY